jgi:hypothetical protein
MKELRTLREYLDQHFPHTVGEEPRCTCGAGNHVRVSFFRVNGQPAVTIVPEGMPLTPQQLREAIGCGRAEALTDTELDDIYGDTELGRMQSFENPFGTTVFFDETLAPFPELVFCPRMFFGRRGECFHVPTDEFLDLTHAIVVPLCATASREPDYWAV